MTLNEAIDWAKMPESDKNALVAEKVLGRVVDRSMTFGRYLLLQENQRGLTEEVPHYTKDMNAALEIVTHLGDGQGLSLDFGYSPANRRTVENGPSWYFCEIMTEWWPEIKQVRAYAMTLQDALCVAALRKEGIQVINAFESLPAWQLTLEDGQQMIFETFKSAMREYEGRVQHLKDRLQWAKNIRKLKIEEIQVPEHYFHGIEMG